MSLHSLLTTCTSSNCRHTLTFSRLSVSLLPTNYRCPTEMTCQIPVPGFIHKPCLPWPNHSSGKSGVSRRLSEPENHHKKAQSCTSHTAWELKAESCFGIPQHVHAWHLTNTAFALFCIFLIPCKVHWLARPTWIYLKIACVRMAKHPFLGGCLHCHMTRPRCRHGYLLHRSNTWK